MSIKLEFVVALNNIRCEGKLHNGIKLARGLRLIDDPSRVPCIKDNGFQKSIGNIELGVLRRSKLLVISEPGELDTNTGLNGQQLVYQLLNVVRSYLIHLWLIRDNCAYFDQGFLFERGAEEDTTFVHANSHAASFFKADGNRSETLFTRRELEQFRSTVRLTGTVQDAVIQLHAEGDARRLISGVNVEVYERFIRFVGFARETTDLGLKIAMYCSALETLLSHSSASELTHKVSERVALLTVTAGQKRIEAFRLMKKLYSIRSAVVHGTDIARKQIGNLSELSKQADQITREVGVTYHNDANFRNAIESQEDAEEFFLKMMFFKE